MNEVENYISRFEPEIQSRLRILQALIFEVVPGTVAHIRYKIPAFKVGTHYLYFAAYKNHIGLYPIYNDTEIENEILMYRAKNTKDSLHFVHNQPLPIDLLKKIIKLKSLL